MNESGTKKIKTYEGGNIIPPGAHDIYLPNKDVGRTTTEISDIDDSDCTVCQTDVQLTGRFYYKDELKQGTTEDGLRYCSFALKTMKLSRGFPKTSYLYVKVWGNDLVSLLERFPNNSLVRVNGELESHRNSMYVKAKNIVQIFPDFPKPRTENILEPDDDKTFSSSGQEFKVHKVERDVDEDEDDDEKATEEKKTDKYTDISKRFIDAIKQAKNDPEDDSENNNEFLSKEKESLPYLLNILEDMNELDDDDDEDDDDEKDDDEDLLKNDEYDDDDDEKDLLSHHHTRSLKKNEYSRNHEERLELERLEMERERNLLERERRLLEEEKKLMARHEDDFSGRDRRSYRDLDRDDYEVDIVENTGGRSRVIGRTSTSEIEKDIQDSDLRRQEQDKETFAFKKALEQNKKKRTSAFGKARTRRG